jgi:4-hydroxy-tetrahydrodipicolinate synthase
MDRDVKGIVPVVQTPLKDGSVDADSLKKHIKWLIQKPIGGLWVLGTGSEDMHLTFDQRVKVARIACAANDSEIPLFIGCGFYSFYETEKFIEETAEWPFDAYHYMPYHPLLSWDRVLTVYQYLSNSVPLWAYSSANWSRPMTPDFVKRLKDETAVKGIKYSTQRTSDLQKVIGYQGKAFQVITAVATQFSTCLWMGAQGSTTSLAGVKPDLFAELYSEFERGSYGAVQYIQDRINEFAGLLNIAKKDNFLSGAEEKALLQNMGLYKTRDMAWPHRALTDEEARNLVYKVKCFDEFRT